MDFVRRTIIDYETVITKELLDSFQDGIIEAITKAEAALAAQPCVYNASTHDEFPSVGSPNVIYKAESERLLYQWNTVELKYEPLCHSVSDIDIFDATLINGGDASGVTDDTLIDGGSASGIDASDEEVVIINGGVASGIND